ncbi:MAG: transcriptional regulator NrdR [Chloroflexota bacterium]
MRCPFCAHPESKVIDSRELEESIRRRRECLSCGKRFTTYERPEVANFLVVKRDGRREEYDRQKLYQGIQRACHKRPVSAVQVESVVTQVEGEILRLAQPEVPSRFIGELVMERLRPLDEIAFMRFASVYRRFQDVDTLAEEIEGLRQWRLHAQEAKAQLPLTL